MSAKEIIKNKSRLIAERHLIMAIDDLFDIAQALAKESDSQIDDAIVSGLGLLKSELKELADKIDPSVDSHN